MPSLLERARLATATTSDQGRRELSEVCEQSPGLNAHISLNSQPAPVCPVCGPAPVLDGPPLPRADACAHCMQAYGAERAWALAVLRRLDGNRAAGSRYERGQWRRIPNSLPQESGALLV